MPELPEVEMVRRQLTEKLIGREIATVTVRDQKSVRGDDVYAENLVGQTITEIQRVGKYLFFTLSGEDSFLITHLRMTGRLIFQANDSDEQIGGGHALSGELPNQPHKHTRIIFTFADGAKLFYNDMRKFGYVKRANGKEVQENKDKLGVEPLDDAYNLANFRAILAGRKTSVKAALLKQSDIAGLGNIYVDEACFRAEVRPDRVAGELTDPETKRLFLATTTVLEDALTYGGTTFRDYVDTDGKHGNFTDELAVFAREGEECPRCGETVEKSKVAGRGTHICPGCQR